MKKIIIASTFLLIYLKADCQKSKEFLLPISNDKIIEHSYYSLGYSETHKHAAWVYYRLTTEFVTGQAKRKNKFKPDPLTEPNAAELADYEASGYDRGHLCPAASMSLNQLAMEESFYLSNMSPQIPNFNRGIWKKLETQVRKWVEQEDTLHVVSGAILTDSLGNLGSNKITIPAYYYKVIYDPTGTQKMIAFILPHQKIKGDIYLFSVSVDEVEKRTGINFFSELDDALENKLEAEVIRW
jgi:endonuclease G